MKLSIEGLQNLNTSCVTNMERMFYGYKGTAIDISSFDTSKVTSMMYAFGNCPNLTNISGIENLNTSNVEKIDGLFCLDAKITSLNLSKWDVSNVTDMRSIFCNTNNPTRFKMNIEKMLMNLKIDYDDDDDDDEDYYDDESSQYHRMFRQMIVDIYK